MRDGQGGFPLTLALSLIAHGPTAATRRAAFPDDGPLLDDAPLHDAGRRWGGRTALTSPLRACRDTALRLALSAQPDPDLADLDHGRWAGVEIAAIAASEPQALRDWIADPAFRAHGGESRDQLARRAATWLEGVVARGDHLVAITHAAVIRAMVVHVLDAPAPAFWRLDIAPGTLTELRHDGRRWALRALGAALIG